MHPGFVAIGQSVKEAGRGEEFFHSWERCGAGETLPGACISVADASAAVFAESCEVMGGGLWFWRMLGRCDGASKMARVGLQWQR
jgi:hypothetical protein